MKTLFCWLLLFAAPLAMYAQNTAEFDDACAKKMSLLFSSSDSVLGIVHTRRLLYPNSAGKSALTPTGWGSSGTHIFGGMGGSFPQLYHKSIDLLASVGVCAGNPVKYVSVVGVVNINDVSKFDNFSYGFIASRFLGKASSIAFGAENIFRDPKKNDAGSSFYLVFSHASQTIQSPTPNMSRLSYSVGLGSGQYATKSPKDILEGKGKYGTIVFGNISYEVIKNVNVSAEWTGINLGFSMGLLPFKKLPGISIGIADVTRFSGDKAHFVFNIGHSLSFHH